VAAVDVFPVAEALGQIAPRDAGAVALEHGLDEQAVVARGDADGVCAAGKEVFNGEPLVITKSVAACGHGRKRSLQKSNWEKDFTTQTHKRNIN
jgi:hypothetical protein